MAPKAKNLSKGLFCIALIDTGTLLKKIAVPLPAVAKNSSGGLFE
jgi:hypothetical protein